MEYMQIDSTFIINLLTNAGINHFLLIIRQSFIRITAVRILHIAAAAYAFGNKPAGLPFFALIGRAVIVRIPRTDICVKGPFFRICTVFLGNNVDDAANSTTAIFDRTTAFCHFNSFNGRGIRKRRKIRRAAAIRGALRICQTLTIDKNQDTVRPIQADIGSRTASHLIVDRYAVDMLNGFLRRRIVILFNIFCRHDSHVRLLFLNLCRDRQCRWLRFGCFIPLCRDDNRIRIIVCRICRPYAYTSCHGKANA